MAKEMDPIPWLHVYAQPFEHAEAWIVGNKRALEALKSAIEHALESEAAAGVCEGFVNDGDGFTVVVMKKDNLGEFATPYGEDCPAVGKHPGEIIDMDLYEKLIEGKE